MEYSIIFCDAVSLDLTPECHTQIPYEVKKISLSNNEQKQVPLHPMMSLKSSASPGFNIAALSTTPPLITAAHALM